MCVFFLLVCRFVLVWKCLSATNFTNWNVCQHKTSVANGYYQPPAAVLFSCFFFFCFILPKTHIIIMLKDHVCMCHMNTRINPQTPTQNALFAATKTINSIENEIVSYFYKRNRNWNRKAKKKRWRITTKSRQNRWWQQNMKNV